MTTNLKTLLLSLYLSTSMYVQDPYLVQVQDICEDPTKIRNEVKRYDPLLFWSPLGSRLSPSLVCVRG